MTLCAFYIVVAGACVAFAFGVSGDPMGHFVILQLPIALQLALLDTLGLGVFLEQLSWVSAYILLGIPTLLALYTLGWLVGRHRSNPSFQPTASGGG